MNRTSRLPYGPGRFLSGHGAFETRRSPDKCRPNFRAFVDRLRARVTYIGTTNTPVAAAAHTRHRAGGTRSDVVILISFSRFSPSARRKCTHFFAFIIVFILHLFFPFIRLFRARWYDVRVTFSLTRRCVFARSLGRATRRGAPAIKTAAPRTACRSTHKLTHTPPGRCFAFVWFRLSAVARCARTHTRICIKRREKKKR